MNGGEHGKEGINEENETEVITFIMALPISCSHKILKGSVQRKLRPRLLCIIQKLLSRRWSAENKIFTFLKGQLTIYMKPLQWSCPSPVTFACKCNSPSANFVHGQKLSEDVPLPAYYCPLQIF